MENDKKNIDEPQKAPEASENSGQAGEAAVTPGTARILAKAGEAFDAVEAGRALHERGLKDPSKVEPTDQSFIFADPAERPAEISDNAPDTGARPAAHPALDLTEAPDPDIPWRARPLSPGSEPLPMGVLQDEGVSDCPRSIYDTEPGLFGPGDSWLFDGPGDENEEGAATELVLGVKFREYGSVYFFRAGKEKIKAGGQVLVETEQGLSLGEVISGRRMRLPLPRIRTAEGDEVEIKPIRGLPGAEDIAAAADNRILATGARLYCKECIRERDLDMKLVDVEVLHDRSKIIFYFTAPTRIDFRELVKDLVRNYRTRIELRQIGVRHETQMLGALGNCGMACCCRRYLRRFAPVTIKMAKEQNLFLNPAKLSGICGRLLCCLANEQENYEEFHRNCPKIGKKYQTSKGVLKVLRANLFRQCIVAVNEHGEEEEFLLDSWHALAPQRFEAREQREHKPDGETGGRAPDAAATMGEEVSEAELAGLEDAPSAPARPDRPHRDRDENHDRQARQGRGQRGKRGGQGKRPQREPVGERPQSVELPGEAPGKPSAPAGSEKSIFGLPGSNYKK